MKFLFLEFNKFHKGIKSDNIYLGLVLIFSFICIFFWGLHELAILGADFGIYYIKSKFASYDFRLYTEIFDHKGPFYYYFLKNIGIIIGWGKYQAIISLILSAFVFFLPVYFIIAKFLKKNIEKIFFIIVSTTLLIGQDGSSSIAFFQEGLLLISLGGILFYRKNKFNFLFIILFFWLSFFTRVDSILFFPVILIYFFDNLISDKNQLNKIVYLIIFFLSPVFIFLYLSNYFDFNFNAFWIHNFVFNNWYSNLNFSNNLINEVQHLIFRPNGLILSSQTIILPYLLYLYLQKFRNIYKDKFYFSLRNIYEKGLINYDSLIIIISFTSYLITKSDKHYYALIFLCPSLLCLVKIFSRFVNTRNLIFPPIFFLLISLNTSNLIHNFEVVFRDLPIDVPYQRTLDFVEDNKIESFQMIGGMGWPYILSNTKPVGSLNNFWMYKPKNPFITNGLISQHNLILSQNPGYLFWIDNGLLKYKNTNIYLKELLINSEIVEDQGFYSMFKIR